MINGKPCCNLNLAGILLPCSVVDLTDEIEFDKDEYVRQLKKVLTEEMEKDE